MTGDTTCPASAGAVPLKPTVAPALCVRVCVCCTNTATARFPSLHSLPLRRTQHTLEQRHTAPCSTPDHRYDMRLQTDIAVRARPLFRSTHRTTPHTALHTAPPHVHSTAIRSGCLIPSLSLLHSACCSHHTARLLLPTCRLSVVASADCRCSELPWYVSSVCRYRVLVGEAGSTGLCHRRPRLRLSVLICAAVLQLAAATSDRRASPNLRSLRRVSYPCLQCASHLTSSVSCSDLACTCRRCSHCFVLASICVFTLQSPFLRSVSRPWAARCLLLARVAVVVESALAASHFLCLS